MTAVALHSVNGMIEIVAEILIGGVMIAFELTDNLVVSDVTTSFV
jgi:hypothetical protein